MHQHGRTSEKLRLTRDFLENTTAEYVIGLDSSDVVLLDHPDEIVRRFRKRGDCDLLFNATGSSCWPALPEFILFESSLPGAKESLGRCWFNSGCWVGRTEFCREYFAAMAAETPVRGYEYSDQAVCKRTWPRWYPRVNIDYRCESLAGSASLGQFWRFADLWQSAKSNWSTGSVK